MTGVQTCALPIYKDERFCPASNSGVASETKFAIASIPHNTIVNGFGFQTGGCQNDIPRPFISGTVIFIQNLIVSA